MESLFGEEQGSFTLLYTVTLLVSSGVYLILRNVIPTAAAALLKRGIYGLDINKISASDMDEFRKQRAAGNIDTRRFKLVPESLGLVTGGVYFVAVCIELVILRVIVGNDSSWHGVLAEYNAGLSGAGFMLLLGFVDDVLDVRWRHKIVLSLVATFPLLTAYQGLTSVLVPAPLVAYLGNSVDLGVLYLVYMMLFCVFCTNSINILAGINGLEVGQCVVIGFAVLLHSLYEMMRGQSASLPHTLSTLFVVPFLAACLGLLSFNRYPSSVFVGDSFTYFGGMVLAVTSVCGHFSKTLILFFIPQLLNFVISLPQLVGIYPCPRHRVPRYDAKTGRLYPSKCSPDDPNSPINFTLLNVALKLCGPMSEPSLCAVLLCFQILCCTFGFFIRYHIASWVYPDVAPRI